MTTLPAGGVGGYRFAAGAARYATLPSYYHPLYVGGRSYYWYGNTWYAPYVVGGVTYSAEAEAPSEYITHLPAGASSIVINGVTYYVVNGAYYLPVAAASTCVCRWVRDAPVRRLSDREGLPRESAGANPTRNPRDGPA